MATTRLIPMHKIKNQSVAYTVQERIDYAVNPDKTLGTELVTAYGCDPATAANEMLLTKRAYADYTGREIPGNDVLLYQIRQSFKPGEITPELAQKIGYELAMTWTNRLCKETSNSLELVVHNKTRYQLTHLLEKGHAKRGGGRVRAFPHIAAAEQAGIRELEEGIKRGLEG